MILRLKEKQFIEHSFVYKSNKISLGVYLCKLSLARKFEMIINGYIKRTISRIVQYKLTKLVLVSFGGNTGTISDDSYWICRARGYKYGSIF